jgi:hypothetical protein
MELRTPTRSTVQPRSTIQPGTGTGAKTGARTGAKTGAGAGAKTGARTRTRTGTGIRTGTGARAGRWTRLTAVLLACALASGCTASAASGSRQNAVADASWTEVWREDFNGRAGSQPPTTRWKYGTGTCRPPLCGTREIETLSRSPRAVHLDGRGHLVITATRAGRAWTSGRIETVRSGLKPGAGQVMRIEALLRQPDVGPRTGAGYWPAFWLLGSGTRAGDLNWPRVGEIDVMEAPNGRDSTFAAMHCGSSPGGPCHEPTGLSSGEQPCAGCSSGFHTYAIEQDRTTSNESIRWYLDGRLYHTVSESQVGGRTWKQATGKGFFIILNLAVGGTFPRVLGGGPNASTVSGRSMLVDHVAVYRTSRR